MKHSLEHLNSYIRTHVFNGEKELSKLHRLILSVTFGVSLLVISIVSGQVAEDLGPLPTTPDAERPVDTPQPRRQRKWLGRNFPMTNMQIKQVGILAAALGLCCGWFTLIAVANQHRGSKDKKVSQVANTLHFFTLGLSALPAVFAKGGPTKPKRDKSKSKKEKGDPKDKLAWDDEDIVFMTSEGQPRDSGFGEASTAAKEIISGAVKREATDIHLEPKGEEIQIRYRIDGELTTANSYDYELGPPIITSLKVNSEMDIAERRKPQDGSFYALVNGHMVDFRVSTAPSSYGEKMVIRVLDKARGIKHLDDLGFQPTVLSEVRRVIHMPHGMLIVCGPTGSGKSTTLYSGISELDASKMNIITIENPVEYQLPNVNQTPINEKAGVTFASVLRSSLRQDPDVLMVGEIRDAETAQVAMQAALTGHLVFTTLHANDAVSSIFRLLDLGLEPFMVSSALSAVLAQRLVRRLCPACKNPYVPTPQFLQLAEKQGLNIDRFFEPVGCEKCENSGYRGRLGVFELLVLNDKIHSLIQEKPSITDIQKAAKDSGILYLREDALMKAAQGHTSIEQVLSLVTK